MLHALVWWRYVTCALSAFAVAPCAQAADLIAHYTFNEGRGELVRDRSGAGRSGQSVGATYVPSPRGYALHFDGVDDQVTYGNNAGFGLRGSFSLAVWLRTDPESGSGTTRLIFGDIANRSVLRNLNVKLDKYQRIHAEWGNGEDYAQVTAEAAVLAGGWHHLALVCDEAAKEAALYLDGKQIARKSVAFAATPVRPGRPVRTGYWWEENAFSGEIDDVKLFRGVLTTEENQALATRTTGAELAVDAPLPVRLPEKIGLTGPADRNGLVAHYRFAEGQGDRLTDHSGHGHHGVIHGATWTKSPWGGALHFDGQDDYVNLGQHEDFWFTRDLTIEMWVRTSPHYPTGRHPLLIGSSASDLAGERHFNMRLDHTKHFRLEWGDRSRYSAVVERPWFFDGDWKHLALVFVSGKACFLYVNGQLVMARKVGLPLTRTRGDDIHLGGWSHGYLQGDIAEVRLYSRAISAIEVQRNGGTPPDQCRRLLRCTGTYSYHAKQFLCDAFVSLEPDAGHTVAVRVLEPETRHVVGEKRVAAAELQGAAGHGAARLVIPGESRRDADHLLETVLYDDHGEVLQRGETAIPYVAPPEWLRTKAGVTDEVLPPYTPCAVDERKDATVVATWGRAHHFGHDGLVSQVVARGQPLLIAPIEFRAQVDGQPVEWTEGIPRTTSHGLSAVHLAKRSTAMPLVLNTTITLEYDGFMKFECALSSEKETTLQSLTLDIPMASSAARLFHAWPVSATGHSGSLTEDWAGPFKPVLWIGDETRGLSWVCESDENWHPADRRRVVEVLRGVVGQRPDQPMGGRRSETDTTQARAGRETSQQRAFAEDATVLRFNLVGKRTQLTPARQLRYTFGLQATPVRPMVRDFWDMRIHRQPPYAHEYDWPAKTIDGVPALKHYADNGARALLVWRWWDAFGYTLPLGHEKRFPDLVKACHDHGLQVVPYTIGFLLSDAAPEYRVFRRDMLTEPEKGFAGVNRLPGLPNQMAYHVCPQGLWREFVTATTAQCMDEYDTDGVYLDTTVRPEPCTNALHNCGYMREDGTRAPTYPVYAIRDLMKRLYTVVLSRKPNGFVDAHIYDCLNVPALAFATGYWNGEQLRNRDVKSQALPLDRFRTELMGHNLGVPADLLFYKLRNYDSSMAIAILHDVPVRCEKEADFETIAQIYRTREAFGCDRATFHGYWEADSPIEVTGESCYASYWQHRTNGVLAAVSNLAPEEQAVRLSIDRSRLGLAAQFAAVDTRSDAPLATDAGVLTVPLQPQTWTLIRLQDQ